MTASECSRLRRAQVLLLALVVTLGVSGRSERYWPVLTWPVYAMAKIEPPGETYSVRSLRVLEGDGEEERELARVRRETLVVFDHNRLARAVVRGAFAEEAGPEREADRAHVVRLLALEGVIEGEDAPVTVEIIETQLAADAGARPGLTLEPPVREFLRARFANPLAGAAQ